MSIFQGKAVGSRGIPDVAELRRALAILPDPEQGFQLLGLPAGQFRTLRGDDADGIVAAAEELADSHSLLWRLHPVALDHGSRPSKVGDILKRRWLLVDIDPFKPPDHKDDPASDAEQYDAWEYARRVMEGLQALGWPAPVVIDSGNGWHCLYRVDLPNDEPTRRLVRAVLTRMAADFPGGDQGKLDTQPYSATYNSRLPGCRNAKGQATPDRPYRLARLFQVPGHIELLTREQLEQYAGIVDLNGHAPPLEPKAEPRKSIFVQRILADPETAYARAALERAAGAVALAPEGQREATLVREAYSIGGFVGSGLLEFEDVYDRMVTAARRAGLPEREARDKARRSIQAGAMVPKTAPQRNGHSNGHAGQQEQPEEATSNDPLDQDATAADLIAASVTTRWIWPKWIPLGVLTGLAAEPGTGKTRFAVDLARRLALALPWPDDAENTFPAGSRTLWVPSDNHHAELAGLTEEYGFSPDLLFLNATKRDPFTGTNLEAADDYRNLERRIARIKPVLVIVDTILNTTTKSSYSPEDAKAIYKPLQEIANRQQVAIICVTHLSRTGQALGRRILGQCRTVIHLDKPDPEQEHRRRLWVEKTFSLMPPWMGVTMGTGGNQYDLDPPKPPEIQLEPGAQKMPSRLRECTEWLQHVLKIGPKKVGYIRSEAERKGFSTKTLYKAKDSLPIDEYKEEGNKWWQLTPEADPPE